jgi:plasmid stabilization system protein ParE
MSQIRYAHEVQADFERFKNFLLEVAPEKISEAMKAIFEGLEILEHTPLAGEVHPVGNSLEMRKLVIPYGQNGYVALYSFDAVKDLVTVHAIRHQKELNFLSRNRRF